MLESMVTKCVCDCLGTWQRYVYDAANRLVRVTDGAGAVSSHTRMERVTSG